jgi:hypothetical protein
MEIAKSVDIVSSDLICRSQYGEGLVAMGKYFVECFDKDGNLKWSDEASNLVVNTGLQYMAGTSLDGATARITAWYVGLITGPGSGTTFAAGDTASLHAGWAENTTYSNSTRPAATFAAATTANPSVVTNSASKATFNINNTATIAGAFLISNDTKGGTSGTLFSASDFTGGDRSVGSGDTLQVTYTFSLAAA